MNESLDDGQTMVAPEKMGEMLLSWTDPQFGLEYVVQVFFLPDKSLVLTDTYSDRAEHLDSIKDTHANVVINILLELYSSERSGEKFLGHYLLLIYLMVVSRERVEAFMSSTKPTYVLAQGPRLKNDTHDQPPTQ